MTRSRVLLIGLDGATFDVLNPLIEQGIMPVLKGLIASGVSATLRSTVPALTPPAWTSLVSGRGPGAHGIFDFFRKDDPASQFFRFLTSRDVACPTMWSLANAAGLRSTVLNFPLTFPAPRVAGYIVPGGFMPWRQLRLGCHPEGLFDRLRLLPSFNARELALDMSEEAKAIEGCAEEEYEPWIDMHIRRERQWVDIARYLDNEEPSDFTAVMFDGTDKIQHLCWRFVDPAMSDAVVSTWERSVAERCLTYFRELDRRIGELCDTFADATVIVASDHGFGPQVRTFFANRWLESIGQLAWRSGQAPESPSVSMLGLNQLARYVYQIDWSRTRAFAPLPSGNGIHIVRADDDHPGGVRADEYDAYRDQLAADLLTIKDPDSGEPVVAQVWTREELFQGPSLALAPDLTLQLQDGGLISILSSPEAVRRRELPTGTHRPDGVFVASGHEIRRGLRLEPLSILDVAPMMMHALALSIPTSFEGRFATEAFEPRALLLHPPRREMLAETVASVGDVGLDAEAEAEILQRLQALGYVE